MPDAKPLSVRGASPHVATRKKETRKTSHVALGGASVSMSKKGVDGGLDALGSGGSGLSSGALFARNLSAMSVAHVARGVGFDAVEKSALDALTEIVAKCTRFFMRVEHVEARD